MTRSIADAVAELKASVCQTVDPDEIQRACIEVGHTWRDRLFDPVTTIWLFTLQIVHCNTACTHVVRLLPGFSGTDSGYCQARSRIPRAVFRRLFELATQRLLEAIDHALDRWHGHRVFFVDGSSCSMPDTPGLQSAFGQPTGQQPGCGFPIANIVGLFHRSGLLVEMLVNPLYTHEARVAHQLLGHLRQGDLLVGDRAFSSYVIIGKTSDVYQFRKVVTVTVTVTGFEHETGKRHSFPHSFPGREASLDAEAASGLEAMLTDGRRKQMRADLAAAAYGRRR